MQGIEQWISIDVCKRWLDVHLRPAGKSFRVSNDVHGINEILPHLNPGVGMGQKCRLLNPTIA
jgi:transposase